MKNYREKDIFKKVFYHGTPLVSGELEPQKSRQIGIFMTPLEEVAKAYAGSSGRVVQTRIKPNARVLDASCTCEYNNWHFPDANEWKRFLKVSTDYGIDSRRLNYEVAEDKPLCWEAVLDPFDGHGENPILSLVLADIGYDIVLTSDFVGSVLGDVYKRFGPASCVGLRLFLDGKKEIPIAIVLNREAIETI